MVQWHMRHDHRPEPDHRLLENIWFPAVPQLVRTLHRPMYTAYHVGLHDIVCVGHAPVLHVQVFLAIHLLEDVIAQRLVEALYVTYAVVLVRDAGLQLNRRLALLYPHLDGLRYELFVQSQDTECVACAMHIDTQRFELYF